MISSPQGRANIGGIMSSGAGNRFHWTVVIGALGCSAAFVWAAIFSFTQVMIGHGGSAGNILRVGIGLLMLFVGVFLLIVGALYWQSLRHGSNQEMS
jgi:hypothetical protein